MAVVHRWGCGVQGWMREGVSSFYFLAVGMDGGKSNSRNGHGHGHGDQLLKHSYIKILISIKKSVVRYNIGG